MLKLIITLAALFLAGFLIVNDHWFVTVSGFGYEMTVSSVLILLTVFVLFYLIHLFKCPFRWMSQFRGKRYQCQQGKRENYLIQIMQAVLENNTPEINRLSKQKKVYQKKDPRQLLIEAFLSPNKEVFEALSERPETELAGLYGLYEIYKKSGDLNEQETILKRANANYPGIPWIIRGQFELSILQNDWEKAITQLELLKKNNLVSKAEYQKGMAGLYLKTGKAKEAFESDKGNPTFALAYAAECPKKAADILTVSWRLTPCWETYRAYMDLFQEEPAGKQMKMLKKLIAKNPTSRPALLAVADTSIRLELWRDAKETMDVYLQTYPLTKHAANLMATIIRNGWHHEEEAREWENKPIEAEDKSGWMCIKCNHITTEWDVACPNCNGFDTIIYK